MQNNSYSSKFAISQSAIKDFRFKSPKKWKQIWIDRQLDLDKDEDSFVFGSLVDTLLFTPSLLKERFYIADVNKIPKGGIEKVIHSVFNKVKENITDGVKVLHVVDDEMLPEPYEVFKYDISSLKKEILEACEEEQWNAHWRAETRVNKIIEKGSEYFGLLDQSQGKKIVTMDMNLEAIDLVVKLKESKDVGKYFQKSKDIENLYQVELMYIYANSGLYETPIKGAIDIVHINHKDKTIQLVDFKTSYSAFDFLKSIKQYNYCDQLSFYNFLLSIAMLDKEFIEANNLPDLKSYKLLEPINIVIDKEEKLPYVYEYNWTDIIISKEGNKKFLNDLYNTTDHNAKIKKGWLEILEEISWHLENSLWEYPKEYYEKGKIKVNLLNN